MNFGVIAFLVATRWASDRRRQGHPLL